MLGFVIRRLLISIPVMIAVSFLVFLMVAGSGDPLAELRARPNTPRQSSRRAATSFTSTSRSPLAT